MGRRSVEVGKFMTRSLTLPLVGIGVVTGKMAYDFEKSFAKIDALVGNANNNLQEMRKQILELSSTELTRGPNELADALYFITSSGFEGSEAMDVLTASSRAAAAGLGETKEVAQLVTSVLKAYGQAAGESGNITDTLIQAVAEGKAEPEEFARSMGRVIPIAHLLGVEFHETAAAVAAFTLQGLNADVSTTSLRSLLTTFTRALPTTQKALAGIGLTVNGLDDAIANQGLLPTMRALAVEVDKFDKSGGKLSKNVYQVFKEAGGGSVGFAKAQETLQKSLGTTSRTLLSKIFPNFRALTSFLILTQGDTAQTAKVFGRTAEAADDMGERTRKALAKRAASPVGQFEFQVQKLRADAIKLGNAFIPVATKLLQLVEKVVDGFNSLPGPIKNVIAGVIILGGLVGPLLIGFGRLLQATSILATKWLADKAKLITANEALQSSEVTTSKVVVGAVEAEARAYDHLYGSVRRAGGAVQVLNAEQVANPARGFARHSRFFGELASGYNVPGRRGFQRQGIEVGQQGRATSIVGYRSPFPGGPMAGKMVGKMGDEAVKASNKFRLFTGSWKALTLAAQVGTRAIGAARIALVGFASFAWPIAAFIALEQIITHWGQIEDKINRATRATLNFLHITDTAGDTPDEFKFKDPAEQLKFVRSFAKELNRLKSVGVSTADAMNEIISKRNLDRSAFGPLIGDALKYARSTKDAVEYTKSLALIKIPQTEEQWNRLANIMGKNKEELKRILEASGDVGKALKRTAAEAAKAFDSAYGRLTEDIMSAFDAQTDELVKNVTYKVSLLEGGVRKAFTLRGDQMTPAERELDALNKLERRQGVMEAIAAAREAAKKAAKEVHIQTRVGRVIWQYDQEGDPDARKAAQKQLRDALRARKRFFLENRADRERTAADESKDEAVKQLTARRDLEKRDLELRLESLRDQLLKRRITIAVFNRRLHALMGKFGVTASDGARLIGTSFGTQLRESLGGVEKVMIRFRKVLGHQLKEVAKDATDAALKVSAAAKAMQRAVNKAVKDMQDVAGLHGLIPPQKPPGEKVQLTPKQSGKQHLVNAYEQQAAGRKAAFGGGTTVNIGTVNARDETEARTAAHIIVRGITRR